MSVVEAKKKCLYAFTPFTGASKLITHFAETCIPRQHLLQDKTVKEDPIERDTHITVFFRLENKAPSAELIAACKKLGPFSVKLGDLKVFQQRDKVFDDGSKHSYDVVVIDVVDPSGKMHLLHRLWGDAYGISAEREAKTDYVYHPHLTIAYQVAGTGEDTVERAKLMGLFTGTEIVFTKVLVKEFRGDKDIKYTVELS